MGLFWTPEAIQDREDIYDYIESDKPAAALALDELFQEKAARLLDVPLKILIPIQDFAVHPIGGANRISHLSGPSNSHEGLILSFLRKMLKNFKKIATLTKT